MKAPFLKSLGMVSLSVLLLYSGIAWTLENCLEDGDEDHERTGYSETSITRVDPGSPLLFSSSNPASHPIAIMHCLVSHYEIGPMAGVSEFRLTPSQESVLLKAFKASVAGGWATSAKADSLWLRALFEWFASVYSFGDVSRHLFLSVFRI